MQIYTDGAEVVCIALCTFMVNTITPTRQEKKKKKTFDVKFVFVNNAKYLRRSI